MLSFCVFLIFAGMKRMLSIGILLFSLLSACNQSSVETRYGTSLQIDASPELSAIDSLLWHQPDSALMRLLPYFDTPCGNAKFCVSTTTEYNRHYAHLLLAELLYKNDYEQNNRPDLLLAVTYFDSLLVLADTRGVSLRKSGRRDAPRASAQNTTATIAFLDARAHYINGVGYYEDDSMVEACKEYMKALDVMDGYFAENELVEKKAKFMALTHTRLTVLFSDHYLHDPAIYFGKNSLHYYEKSDDFSWHLAWMLDEIGLHYDMLEAIDSATYYYEKGLNLLPDTDNLTYRDISTHLAFLSYKKGESMESSLIVMRHIIDMANSDKEYYSRCLTIGEIFYHAAQFDSAWPYYNKVFNYTQSEDSKKLAAERLAEISKVVECRSNSTEYSNYLARFATISERQSALNSTLVELYRQYGQDKEAYLRAQNNRKKNKQVTWVMCSLIVLTGLSVVVNIIIRSRNKKLKKEKQKTEELLETENYSHKIKQAALSSKLKKRNEALRIQKKETNDLAKEMAIQQRQTEWNHLNDFMNESICNDIVTALRGKQIKREAKSGDYPELHLSDAQLHELNVAVEKHFHGFEKTLTDLYPKISRNAMNQCLLYLVNMEDVQIAALLSCDYSTVKRRSAKLKQAFGTEKELRQFIREFVL